MATAEELLNSLSDTETYSDDPGIFVINDEDRTIDVPSNERLFGVTGDKDVERKYFQCPKIVGDNIDLSQHQIYISYVFTTSENNTIFPTIGNGRYHCEDVKVSGDNITFSWLLSGNVLSNPGFIAFKVMAMKNEGDELKTKWNTAAAFGTVLITVPDGEDIAEEYPDVINQIFDRLDALESGGGGGTGGTTNYENLSNKPQLNGVTLEGNKTLDQVGVLAKNQGSSNSGKYLSVGSDGNVVPTDAPSGGTVDPEQIKQAVNGYLEENPVSGMTAEQEQQLNQNTQDVADLKSAMPQKIDKNQGKDNANKYLKTDSDGNVSLASFTLYSENGTEYELVVSDDGVLSVKKIIHDINNVKILDIDMTNWNEKEYVTDLVSETKFNVNKEEKNIVPSVKYYSSYDLMKNTLLEKGFTIFYSYDLGISDSNILIYQYSGMVKSYSNLDGNWKYYLTWFSQYFTANNISQNNAITQWNIYPFPTDPQINTCIMSYKDTTVTVYFNGDKVGEFNCGSIENAIQKLFNGMPTTSNGEAVTHYTIYEGTVTDEGAKQITDFFF